ncbi:DUF262 domain-containing protein [Bacteroides sp. 214]|uniref:DUF262 domain-containing protein n=1 Tax=Bacteroides sp. 214 TaxID=2302935 RepID=UPI0013CF4C9A|nr:DUF262 domain-containing protein [Bacteroides sp. 214]NDW11923.1 DUF262 domain-containing protein [Bacteroides sp. 214]
MNEFIYSIKDIFSNSPKTGCLGANKQEVYYIASYQRGYKWASERSLDQVPQLLIDLYEAFCKGTNEYYLQYITVKPDNIDSDKKSFEVIDGQQRLTTLSLLFYVLEKQGCINITKDKILYARYDENIFEKVIEFTVNTSDKDDEIPTQDLYYMVRACRCITMFFELFNDENYKNKFIEYIMNNVKIIVNKESVYVSSEDVFSNLNDNKVPLTNAYLIKGLLLTKASRKLNMFGKPLHFKEIVDQRNIMGRTWDEINAWFNEEKVKYFFFKANSKADGMEHMLKLVELGKGNEYINDKGIIQQFKEKLSTDKGAYTSQFELFNRYKESVASVADANHLLSEIKHIYRCFKNIYNNPNDNSLFNLLGYSLFHSKEAKYELKNIASKSGKDLKAELIDNVISILPNKEEDLRALKYPNKKINQWLLALSVFPEDKKKQYRFDFYSYGNEKWSLEHISPQNPEVEIKVDDSVVEWLCGEIQKKESLSDKKKVLINSIRTEKKIDAKDIAFLYENVSDVDVLGNMALLSSGVNSSLSNNPFPMKRRILFGKSNQGYFVPKHTLDVFAKTLPAKNDKYFNPDFVKWDDTDIFAHTEWMANRYLTLIDDLKQQKI